MAQISSSTSPLSSYIVFPRGCVTSLLEYWIDILHVSWQNGNGWLSSPTSLLAVFPRSGGISDCHSTSHAKTLQLFLMAVFPSLITSSPGAHSDNISLQFQNLCLLGYHQPKLVSLGWITVITFRLISIHALHFTTLIIWNCKSNNSTYRSLSEDTTTTNNKSTFK